MGRYWHSVQLENVYPYELREIWVAHQPKCDEPDSWRVDEKNFLVTTVQSKAGVNCLRVVSKPRNGEENKRVVSILDQDQNQFIETISLECQ